MAPHETEFGQFFVAVVAVVVVVLTLEHTFVSRLGHLHLLDDAFQFKSLQANKKRFQRS